MGYLLICTRAHVCVWYECTHVCMLTCVWVYMHFLRPEADVRYLPPLPSTVFTEEVSVSPEYRDCRSAHLASQRLQGLPTCVSLLMKAGNYTYADIHASSEGPKSAPLACMDNDNLFSN